MGRPERIQFFVTKPHECSYLENREVTAIFADPYSPMSNSTFGILTEMGFRRSGEYIYKPRCFQCQACIPVRIPTALFQPSRSQKRVFKKNKDLKVEIVAAHFRGEDYELYENYINSKHHDGGMHPPSIEQYKSFLFCEWSNSQFIRFLEGEKVIAVAVVDQLPNGLSAVYTFYDYEQSHRSLGTYAILWQIEHCRQHDIKHVYLGYLIESCQKMAYKNQFLPFEKFVDEQWVQIIKTTDHS